jgi:hypothetical protein
MGGWVSENSEMPAAVCFGAKENRNAMNDALRKIESWLRESRDSKRWGSLTIKVKDGSPFLIETTNQIKPSEDYPDGKRFSR